MQSRCSLHLTRISHHHEECIEMTLQSLSKILVQEHGSQNQLECIHMRMHSYADTTSGCTMCYCASWGLTFRPMACNISDTTHCDTQIDATGLDYLITADRTLIWVKIVCQCYLFLRTSAFGSSCTNTRAYVQMRQFDTQLLAVQSGSTCQVEFWHSAQYLEPFAPTPLYSNTKTQQHTTQLHNFSTLPQTCSQHREGTHTKTRTTCTSCGKRTAT